MTDHVDVVLHEQHRGAFLSQRHDVVEQRLLQRRVDAGHRLVQHDQLRIRHQRTGHFQQLALASGKRARIIVLLFDQQEPFQQRLRFFDVRLLLLFPHAGEQRAEHAFARLHGGTEQHVVQHGQTAHHLGQLECAHHAHARHFLRLHVGHVLAIELPCTGVRRIETGHQIEERGFAGAVRSDQRGDAVAFDFEVADVHGGHAAEFAGHVVGHQNRVGFVHTRLVLHEFQIIGDFVPIGGGDQGLAFRRFGGPFGQVLKRHSRLHSGWALRGGRSIRCLRHGKPTPFGRPTGLAV